MIKYTTEKPFITYDFASVIIKKAIDYAQSINLLISVAVVDPVGNLVAFSRMDDAILISIGTAQGKALTAAKSTLSTKVFIEFLKENHVDFSSLQEEKLMPIQGGLPIIYKGKLIGGIGIGGGTGEQDEACARFALETSEK